MSRVTLNPGTMLAPLPAAMVSCGTVEKANVLTVAWTGVLCTKPPMVYISLRPSRYSYGIIRDSGEFVLNLTASKMVRAVDYCGVKSGRDVDKLRKCDLHPVPGTVVSAPVIAESPLALECRIAEVRHLGSHDMFIADVVSVSADERYLDSKGKLNLEQAGLMAYAHGNYHALGRKLGDFGYSVRKNKKI